MNTKPFDPANAFRFELSRGRIAVTGAGPRVMLPVDALQHLLAGLAPAAARDFGQLVGSEVGRRVAERLGSVASATPDAVLDHLGGEWALSGLGSLGIEVWGKALVFTISESPFGPLAEPFIAAALEGAIVRAWSRPVSVLPLQKDDDKLRLLITGPKGASRVQALQGAGRSYAEILADLNQADTVTV